MISGDGLALTVYVHNRTSTAMASIVTPELCIMNDR